MKARAYHTSVYSSFEPLSFTGYLIVSPTVSQQLDVGDIPDLSNISSVSEWKENCRAIAGDQALKDIEVRSSSLLHFVPHSLTLVEINFHVISYHC